MPSNDLPPQDEDQALWEAWVASGVTAETPLTVDYSFYTAVESRARCLVEALQSEGFAATLTPKRTLLFFKGWLVEAREQNTGWSLHRLQERSATMTALAVKSQVLYDGCGAEMP